MNENPLRLTLSTRAIAGSEQAVHLIEQKERLEAAAMAKDAPLCLDMSKAFLESIFKTILSDRIEEPNLRQEFYPLFRNVKDEISFSDDQNASDLVGRLAGSIVNVVSELRNNFGAASHGDDGFHQNPIDMTSAEFVMSSVDGLASLVYRKHKDTVTPETIQRFNYQDFEEFNDWFDEQNEDYQIALGSGTVFQYSASQILFDQDLDAYREMLIQYTSSENENK